MRAFIVAVSLAFAAVLTISAGQPAPAAPGLHCGAGRRGAGELSSQLRELSPA